MKPYSEYDNSGSNTITIHPMDANWTHQFEWDPPDENDPAVSMGRPWTPADGEDQEWAEQQIEGDTYGHYQWNVGQDNPYQDY